MLQVIERILTLLIARRASITMVDTLLKYTVASGNYNIGLLVL